jgi:hypothetical protein
MQKVVKINDHEMRTAIMRGNIRVAGAIGDSAIGLLDEPVLPQAGGTYHVAFRPFDSQIGTTTLVQRLCGADSTFPNPSSGINGYRAVWSIEMDSVGTVRYENFFMWDISHDTMTRDANHANDIIHTCHVVVLVLPCSANERNITRAIEWCQAHVADAQRLVVAITQCDKPEQGHIRPRDIERISGEWECAVVRIEGANIKPDGRNRLNRTVRNLVLAIDDCLTSLAI